MGLLIERILGVQINYNKRFRREMGTRFKDFHCKTATSGGCELAPVPGLQNSASRSCQHEANRALASACPCFLGPNKLRHTQSVRVRHSHSRVWTSTELYETVQLKAVQSLHVHVGRHFNQVVSYSSVDIQFRARARASEPKTLGYLQRDRTPRVSALVARF